MSVVCRSSSLTRVTPPTAPPRSLSPSFYPEFLRNRITPARHDVVADEVDKELLLNATDPRRAADSTGLSSEIREFLKSKQEKGDKEDPWVRLDEMVGFSMGGFGFFSVRLGTALITGGRKDTAHPAISHYEGCAFWDLVYGPRLGTASPMRKQL